MKTTEQRAAERAVTDLAEHRLSVLHDSGLYKHLLFKAPTRSEYWFEIITAPGTLTVNGDMGTYVFAREQDMIRWFIGSSWQGAPNVDYWAEKCKAPEGRRGLREYSEATLRQRIEEALTDAVRDEELGAEEEADLRSAAEDFIGDYELSDPSAYGDLSRFGWNLLQPFSECWEWSPYEYTYQYVWTAHALLRALTAYREHEARLSGALRPPAAFEQPDLQQLHRSLVADARERPEYSTPEALGGYSEGVEHAIESLWMKGYRDASELARAWHDAGPRPDYHEAMKKALAHRWPTLHDAVEKTTKGARP